jgi:predicted Zn-dependent peptidase
MLTPARDPDLHLHTLPGGVRVLALHQPLAATATAAVFVASGSAHEGRDDNGIGHVVEHMVFKGTATRDARRINLDAERLGAEVNAHTDKDHTALHMRGLAAHADRFVPMLAELVLAPTFPSDELERERQVLLQEHAEDSDDPVATGFKLFDRACFGLHPAAQPVIGPRRHVERFTRAELHAWVRHQFTAPNIVVTVAGPLVPEAVFAQAEAHFGAAPPGTPNRVPLPGYQGGIATQRQEGSSQTHVVLGFPIPALAAEDPAATVAAAVFGDGMSSPLLDTVREKHALAYHAACSADVLAVCGQWLVEASTAPEQADALLAAVMTLLHRQAEAIDPVDLERARNQLHVRHLRAQEKPLRRLEAAALDLFTTGHVRPAADRLAALQAVTAEEVRSAFACLLAHPPALALTGEVPRGTRDRVRRLIGP